MPDPRTGFDTRRHDHRYRIDVDLGPAAPDPDELRANLLQADPGVLVAVLAQLTGDPSVIERYGPKISHVPDPPERAGVTDPDTAAALVDAVIDALERAPRPTACLPTTAEFFARLLPIALGSDVDDEHVDLLLEQGGFQRPQPTLPRTVPIPETVTIAIIGAGIAGINVALAAAEEGVALRDLRPQRRSRRHLADHHLPRHRCGHTVGVLLAVA